MLLPTLLCSLLPFVHAKSQPEARSNSLTVSTTSGHIRGKIDNKFLNVRQFLGIPFAAPPVGDLRWAAPQPISQPDKLVIATSLPPSCPQFLNNVAPSVYNRQILEFNLQGLNTTGIFSIMVVERMNG